MAVLSFACSNQKIQYPETLKDTTVDNYFGTKVEDPYRWLEDDNSKQTGEWVAAQNIVTEAYMKEIPARNKIVDRLTQLWNYSRMGNLTKRGDYYFYSFNTGLQNQDVIMYKKNLSDAGQVFLNPNSWSDEGTVALSTFSASNDGKYVGYGKAVAGSDWNEFFVKEIEGLKDLDDHLKWIKFSSSFYFDKPLNPEQTIKIFPWNQEKQPIYFDDFKIIFEY